MYFVLFDQNVNLLRTLLTIGTFRTNHIVILFQVITCGISMFICNTATCAMMCPILKVGVEDEDEEEEGSDGDNETTSPS